MNEHDGEKARGAMHERLRPLRNQRNGSVQSLQDGRVHQVPAQAQTEIRRPKNPHEVPFQIEARMTIAPPNTHMVTLSVEEMKGLDIALQLAFLRGGNLQAQTRALINVLHARFQTIIPRCEALDRERERAGKRAGNLRPALIFFCITENCTAVVDRPGEHCLDCQDPGAA